MCAYHASFYKELKCLQILTVTQGTCSSQVSNCLSQLKLKLSPDLHGSNAGVQQSHLASWLRLHWHKEFLTQKVNVTESVYF